MTQLLVITSCKKEVIDLDKKSDTWEFEKTLVAPIIKGTLLLSDLTGDVDDTDTEVLVIDGDTVKLHIIRDTLLYYNTSDLVVIPAQSPMHYIISNSGSNIDVSAQTNNFVPFELITDTVFNLSLKNSMRLDSMYINSGQIFINVQNSYDYDVVLNLHSDSIIDSQNNYFNRDINVGRKSNISNYPIDLSGYKIIFGHTANAATTVKMILTPNFDKSSGTSGFLLFSELIDIEFNVSDMNDFDILYGFMGYQGASYDTITDIIIEGMEEELRHVSGTFQATNPKIWLNYRQSFGVPMGADLFMDIYHHDAADESIDLEPKLVPAHNHPDDPKLEGTFLFSNVDNIDELLTFPIADSVHITGDITTNPGLDSVTTKNFVKRESEMLFGLDIELPLEFSADLTYYDTIKFDAFEDFDENDEFEFEYLNLHSRFINTFPLSFDAMLLLYNEDTRMVIDSVDLNSKPGEPFLQAAPVDENGIVILSQVTEKFGVIALDDETANNLLLRATHLIVKAKIQSTATNSVKVLHTSKLDFQFAIEAKGKMILED